MNDDYEPYIEDGKVMLPHQCDAWYVGGKKELKKFIAALQELLKDPELKE